METEARLSVHRSAQLHHQAIRRITPADLRDVLRKGLDDFQARPTHGIFICAFYPLVALLSAWVGLGYELLPLVVPLIIGFALIGPLAASGLYELSRRREQGLDYAWWHVFDVLKAPSLGAFVTLGIIMAAIFVLWLQTALYIYAMYFGDTVPTSVTGFVQQVFTTRAGWGMALTGGFAGLVFAVIIFTTTIFSLPMLLDRKASVFEAVGISIRGVLANLPAMVVWSLVVAGLLFIGTMTLLIGLAIVMPVLGHSTWHLYRKVVAPPH
jgi:uncharacterized membrane protein